MGRHTKPLRKCNRCGAEKPKHLFYGMGRYCKPCNTVMTRESAYKRALRKYGPEGILSIASGHIVALNSLAKVLRLQGLNPEILLWSHLDKVAS